MPGRSEWGSRFWHHIAVLAAVFFCSAAFAERLEFVHSPPDSVVVGNGIELVGSIAGSDDLAKAHCRYRRRGEDWRSVKLVREYGDWYRANIPGDHVLGPSIEYFCVGFDYFGTPMELYRSASAPRRIRVEGEIMIAEGLSNDSAEVTSPEVTSPIPLVTSETGALKNSTKIVPFKKGSKKTKDKPAGNQSESSESKEHLAITLFKAEDTVSLPTLQNQMVSDAPAMATAVFEDAIRSLGLRTLPDVLKVIPGFETSRDVQGFWRVAARGIRDESALLILYDGHRLNNAYDAKALLNIPTENVQQVEAIRGPGSALYGANAFLGVVNLNSKRRDGLEGAISSGSSGLVEGNLFAGTNWGSKWSFYFDGTFSRSDGYRKPIDIDASTVNLEETSNEPVGYTNDRNQLFNIGTEARLSLGKTSETRLSLRFLREDRGALLGLFDRLGPNSRLWWNVFFADIVEEIKLSAKTVFSVHAYFDEQRVNRKFQVATRGYYSTDNANNNSESCEQCDLYERTKFTSRTYGVDSKLELSIAQFHKLIMGVDANLQRLDEYSYELNFDGTQVLNYMRNPYNSSQYEPLQKKKEFAQRLEAGGFFQYQWKIFTPLTLTIGLRLDITELPNPKISNSEKEGVVYDTRFAFSWNPRLGLVWSPSDTWSVKLLYGRAFRAPTIQELAEKIPENSELNRGRFKGNPNLRPAVIHTIEAGVESILSLKTHRLRLRGNVFYNHFANPIAAVDFSGNVPGLTNRDLGVEVLGVESEIRYELSNRAFTLINYSWFRAWDRAAKAGEYLTDVPQYRLNWATQIPLGNWLNFSVLSQAGAARKNNRRSILESLRSFRIPPYFLLGAQISSEPIAGRFEFSVTARNLFQSEIVDDVPRPDRTPELLPREGFSGWCTLRASY